MEMTGGPEAASATWYGAIQRRSLSSGLPQYVHQFPGYRPMDWLPFTRASPYIIASSVYGSSVCHCMHRRSVIEGHRMKMMHDLWHTPSFSLVLMLLCPIVSMHLTW